jgi:hypothetical protein
MTAPDEDPSAVAEHLPPPPNGPDLKPQTKARHDHYVAHVTFHLPNGQRFDRGHTISGKDALAFEIAVAKGETNENFASALPHNVDPRA